MKVLACDGIAKKGIELLREHFEVEERGKVSEDELSELLSSGKYSALIVRSATKVTARVIQSARGLKVIGRAGIGVDNIDVAKATEKGIVVMNTLGAANTTAEHTLALIFAVARKIPQAHASLKAGKWEKKKFVGRELKGKTIGIIGLGNIGRRVAQLCSALDMNVIFYDPYVAGDGKYRKVELDELLREADIITVHTPLTEKTRNLISHKEFEKMKDGVIVINCARGGIINEQALAEYVRKGKVWGAGVDVFEKEPPDPENPLLKLDNVVVTPHLGASTEEAQELVAVEIANKIIKFLKEGIIVDAVNFFPIGEEQKGLFDLAGKLGDFAIQSFPHPPSEVWIETNVEDMSAVKVGALWGIMKNIVGEDFVTPLNAERLAKQRGISIKERKVSASYSVWVSVTLISSDGRRQVAGAMIEGRPRIVLIDGMNLEAVPEGDIIFLENEDKPGVLGKIGTLLGSHNINIASIHLGREEKGKRAVAFIRVDTKPPESVLEELTKIPEVIGARFIRL